MRRRRVRWWHVWLVLLALSLLVQEWRPRADPAGARTLDLPAQTARGPLAGRPVRVAYEELGQGQPVIYLHGSPGSGLDGARLARQLADSFRVLTVDLPGFGRSERRVPDYGIQAHARYVLALMDRLGIEAAHLIGHSMGGGVALLVADAAPDRVLSVTSYGGIGIQEGEGSGDYHLEHLKYAVGWVFLVAIPEVVPHFGLLGRREARTAFIRNFWDSDQRPIRGVLERFRRPLLILHGRDDPLVPAWVAEEHHALVEQSELVIFDASHFLVFSAAGSERLVSVIRPFLNRHRAPDARAVRRTDDRSGGPRPLRPLAARIDRLVAGGPWRQLARLAAASVPFQHTTWVLAGFLFGHARVDPFVAWLGCVLGTLAADGLLYGAGRWIVRPRPFVGWIGLGQRIERRLGMAVIAARWIPGSRVLLLPALGASGGRPLAFVAWCLATATLSVAGWLTAAAWFGPLVAARLERWLGLG